jgi:hypothetical protein
VLDHPGCSTHPFGALTDIRLDAVPSLVNPTVDDAGVLHWGARATNGNLITLVPVIAPMPAHLMSGQAFDWQMFTLIPS